MICWCPCLLFFVCLLVPLPPHGLNALRCLRGRGCGACQRGARLKPASLQVAPLCPLAPATPRKWPSSKTVASCIRCLWCLCGGTRCGRRETSAGLEGRPGCDYKDLECGPSGCLCSQGSTLPVFPRVTTTSGRSPDGPRRLQDNLFTSPASGWQQARQQQKARQRKEFSRNSESRVWNSTGPTLLETAFWRGQATCWRPGSSH